jgi:hypothetical protein
MGRCKFKRTLCLDGKIMSKDREIISDVRGMWDEYWGQRRNWQGAAEEDWHVYLGNQWAFVPERVRLQKEGRPELSINICKKNIDVIEGMQRQNKRDLKAFPMEGGDEAGSDVYTQMFRWVMRNNGGLDAVSMAFKDALVCGVGFIHPYICYEEDVINGEIRVIREDPFKILFDPHMTMPDLSDCYNILRHSYIQKNKAIMLWPDREKDLKKLEGSAEMQVTNFHEYHGSEKNMLNVIERWHKEKEKGEFLFNRADGIVRPVPDRYDRNDYVERMVGIGYELFEADLTVIRLQIVAEKDMLIYDGPSPFTKRNYPFIPVFCYYEPTCPQWEWRMQGMVRSIKDLQVEKNKRRSQLMNMVLSMPQAGFYKRRDANIDVNQLKEPGIKIVDVDDLDADLREMNNVNVGQPLITLEQLHDSDINRVSLNPDMLGMVGGQQGGSAASAAGVSLRLRQQQGMASMQGVFDNLNKSMRMLGKNLMCLIDEFYDITKVARICGDNIQGVKQLKKVQEQIEAVSMQQPQTEEEGITMQQQLQDLQNMAGQISAKIEAFWEEFEYKMGFAAYDCTVDEINSSPTHRADILAQLSDWIHQGYPVPPDIILEYTDLSPTAKEMWQNYLQQQQQMQAEQAQAEIDSKMAKEKLNADTQIKTALINKLGGEKNG